jgi:GxxExxY protein
MAVIENKLVHGALTEKIIGAAMEVHRILGAGFLESVYEEALAIEFNIRKIPFEKQKTLKSHIKVYMQKNLFVIS